MSIEIRYMTENPCFGAKRRLISPSYIIVHSTGCAISSKENLFARWNKSSAAVSVHGMVDAGGVLITLPLNYRGWHVGALGNGKTVGFEVCEGPNMAYMGGSTIDTSRTGWGLPATMATLTIG
jgi:N-acetylmuramoyl-L-alanine amidase